MHFSARLFYVHMTARQDILKHFARKKFLFKCYKMEVYCATVWKGALLLRERVTHFHSYHNGVLITWVSAGDKGCEEYSASCLLKTWIIFHSCEGDLQSMNYTVCLVVERFRRIKNASSQKRRNYGWPRDSFSLKETFHTKCGFY